MVRGRIIRLWGGSQAGGQGGRLRARPTGRGRTAGAPTPDIWGVAGRRLQAGGAEGAQRPKTAPKQVVK
eukprot:gene21702-biopygen23650